MYESNHNRNGQRPRGSTMPPAIRSVWSLLVLGVSVSLLGPRIGAATTIRVPADAPTIQAGINLAQSGDDVLVAPGVYYEYGIVLKGGVWVHTEQGPEVTIVDAQRLGRGFSGVDLAERVTVEGLTIRNGLTTSDGGAVYALRALATIRNCIILDCEANWHGGGIHVEGPGLEISACRVSNCIAGIAGGGILAWAIPSGDAAISDCLITGNLAFYGGAGIAAASPYGRLSIIACHVAENIAMDGFEAGGISCAAQWLQIRDCIVTRNVHYYYSSPGIAVGDGSGEIVNCTVSQNTGLSFSFAVDLSGSLINLERSIISFNDSRGVNCGAETTLRCNDIFGNTGGGDICGEDLGGNFSADPLFCDAANGDYTLDWASPCLPGNHPNGVDCGLIGALGPGCGTPPVTGACCFADDTCVVAEPQDCASQGGSYLGDDTDCDPNPCIPTARESTTWGRIRAGYR